MKKRLNCILNVAVFILMISPSTKELFDESPEKFIYCEIIENGKNNNLISKDDIPIKFNSFLDALNYMGNRGWVISLHYVMIKNDRRENHWILKQGSPSSIQNLNYKLIKKKILTLKKTILILVLQIIYDMIEDRICFYIFRYIRHMAGRKFTSTLKNLIRWCNIFDSLIEFYNELFRV